MNEKNVSYRKIIEEGQDIMSNSLDPFHSFSHAQCVEHTALNVYKELKENRYKNIDQVSPELVRIAAWWHDCYKSQLSQFSLAANFNEGTESAKIIRNKLTSRMNSEELELLVEAVENHAGSSLFPYFFLNHTKSPLHKILLEADAHDLVNVQRVTLGYPSLNSLGRVLWTIVDIIQVIALPLYLRTKTTQKQVYSRIWRFWGAWLWKEKYFWKALVRLTHGNQVEK